MLQTLINFYHGPKRLEPSTESDQGVAERQQARLQTTEGIVDWMLSTFADEVEDEDGGKSSYVRAKLQQDRLVSYILVFWLHLDDYKTRVNLIAKVLSTTVNKMNDHFKVRFHSLDTSQLLLTLTD